MNSIYLDNNSTTAIDPDVVEAVSRCMSEGYVNPASQHQLGQKSRRRLEEIRTETLGLLGANDRGMTADSLVFTSGGTESNNLALTGLAFEKDGTKPVNDRIVVSSIEHPSVLAAAEYLSSQGFQVEKVTCCSNGQMDLDHLNLLLQQPTRLVSVMAVNHETGSIQPIKEISKLCRDTGVLVHCDAVQAVGKMPISFADLGIDALSFTAHKLHGPKGIGGLILRNKLNVFPRFFGGFQQQGWRPGTEDVCLATGMLIALRKFHGELEKRLERIRRLRDRMETRIKGNIDIRINGQESDRVPHTINVSFLGVSRQEFLMAADMNGIAISTGSACASGSSNPSPVLVAMGLPENVIEGAIRISLSAMTTEAEIDSATERIIRISKDLRR